MLRILLLLRDDLLDLRNLGLDVVAVAPQPGQGAPRLPLPVVPHEPDRGLGQQPAQEEEHQAGAAEGEGVELHRHHQAQAQRRQRAQVVGEAVEASQLLAVPDQADLWNRICLLVQDTRESYLRQQGVTGLHDKVACQGEH